MAYQRCNGALISVIGNTQHVSTAISSLSAYGFSLAPVLTALTYLSGSNLHVTDNVIDSTFAYNGGGVYFNSNEFQVLRNKVTNTSATQDGGAFYIVSDGDTVGEVFSGNTISECTAQNFGGAVRVAAEARFL